MPTWVLRLHPADQRGSILSRCLGSLVPRIAPERTSEFAQSFAQIPALTAKIDKAQQADWSKWPSVTLANVLESGHAETVFSALGSLQASHPQ